VGIGGAGIRTPDPVIMIHLLYQLSYTAIDEQTGRALSLGPGTRCLSRVVLTAWIGRIYRRV
jgi:hypothetical protein